MESLSSFEESKLLEHTKTDICVLLLSRGEKDTLVTKVASDS
jgi:hypothetical protein